MGGQIGLVIGVDKVSRGFTIQGVVPGGSAALHSTIALGERLLSVNGCCVDGLTLRKVRSLIVGAVGTTVELETAPNPHTSPNDATPIRRELVRAFVGAPAAAAADSNGPVSSLAPAPASTVAERQYAAVGAVDGAPATPPAPAVPRVAPSDVGVEDSIVACTEGDAPAAAECGSADNARSARSLEDEIAVRCPVACCVPTEISTDFASAVMAVVSPRGTGAATTSGSTLAEQGGVASTCGASRGEFPHIPHPT